MTSRKRRQKPGYADSNVLYFSGAASRRRTNYRPAVARQRNARQVARATCWNCWNCMLHMHSPVRCPTVRRRQPAPALPISRPSTRRILRRVSSYKSTVAFYMLIVKFFICRRFFGNKTRLHSTWRARLKMFYFDKLTVFFLGVALLWTVRTVTFQVEPVNMPKSKSSTRRMFSGSTV
jgi:hypothetical protein